MEIIRKFLILSLLVCSTLPAQWSQDPNNNLQVSNFGYFVSSCEDGMGGAFIAWGPPQGFFYEIWMQWVDKYGYVRWSTPKRIQGIGESRSNFNLLKAEKGKAIIVYYDSKLIGYSPPPSYPIFKHFITLNKIDTNGVLLWGDYGKRVTVDTNFAGTYNCVEDQNDGVYIQWNEMFRSQLIGESDSTIIRLQRISSIGERLWGDSGKAVYTMPKYYDSSPSISKRYPEGIFLLYSRKYIGKTLESYNSDGSLNWSKVNQWYGVIEADSTGGGAWAYDARMANSSKFRILANKIDNNGDLLWGDTGLVIVDDLEDNFNLRDRKLLCDGSLVIYWRKKISDFPTTFNIYIQIVNQNGTLIFNDSGVVVTATPVKSGEKITISDSTNFILDWFMPDSSSKKWYCQKFTNSMQRLWNIDVLITNRDAQLRVGISDNNYGLIKVWSEYYSPGVGIFMQQVNKNGQLGEVITKINYEIDVSSIGEYDLMQNYPNPFNSFTKIKYKIPATSKVTIKLFNILGKEVATLINDEKSSGIYDTEINIEQFNLSSGTYFIELRANNYRKTIKTLLIK